MPPWGGTPVATSHLRRIAASLITILLASHPTLLAIAGTREISPCCSLFSGPIEIDPTLDMPANPTIEQQIAAGNQLLSRLQVGDQTLDHDSALNEYFNELIKRLLAAQDVKPPYPIVVHVSTEPELNAYASAGGQMVIYSRIIEESDNEAQLVAIVGHELSHEIHNDYVFFWNAAKAGQDSYGANGLLDQSRAIELRADLDAIRMMYNAGWNPDEQVKMMTRLKKMSQTERDNHRVFYSTHPDDPERIDAARKLISTLPAKPGLITDSPRFQELKQAL
jgi:predicted Zn-dependent protease